MEKIKIALHKIEKYNKCLKENESVFTTNRKQAKQIPVEIIRNVNCVLSMQYPTMINAVIINSLAIRTGILLLNIIFVKR